MRRTACLLSSILFSLCLLPATSFADDPKPPATAGATPAETAPAKRSPALLEPAKAKKTAPEEFRVRFTTTKGAFVVEVNRAWAPNGADRFYNLVDLGFYEEIAFFRVIPNFMAQFGIHGAPQVSKAWSRATIPDDPVVQSNSRGMISYAKTNQPSSRTTQLFINLTDNTRLDGMGFAPFARVVEGMDVVDAITKTGEGAPRGPGPNQRAVRNAGNDFLKKRFPQIDYLTRAELVE